MNGIALLARGLLAAALLAAAGALAAAEAEAIVLGASAAAER